MTQKLPLIDIENRNWLKRTIFILAMIPMLFIAFFTTIGIPAILLPSQIRIIYMFLMAIVFFIGSNYFILKIYYSPIMSEGNLLFSATDIQTEDYPDKFHFEWKDIHSLKYFYKGDDLWKTKIFNFTYMKGEARYKNSRFSLFKKYKGHFIDYIDINNGTKIYIKIRNEAEKQAFDKFIQTAQEAGVKTEAGETEYIFFPK